MRFAKKIERTIRKYIAKLRGKIDYGAINLERIDSKFIRLSCEKELQKNQPKINRIINSILKYNDGNVPFKLSGERGFPGEPEFISSGHSNNMIYRYLFAANFFCKNMKALDSCSGYGWGAYLVSHYAKELFAFDMDPKAIQFSRKEWGEKGIKWHIGNALDTSFLNEMNFDCALAMETLEHFSVREGSLYIKNLHSMIRKGGVLIGSTPMAADKQNKKELIEKNPFHLTAYTPKELYELLMRYFARAHIVDTWMFIARK